MNNKKILMITGDFTEDYETIAPSQAHLTVGHRAEAIGETSQHMLWGETRPIRR